MVKQRRIPKRAVFKILALALFLSVSCSVEEDLLQSEQSKRIIHKKLSLEEVRNEKYIMSKLSDYTKGLRKMNSKSRTNDSLIIDISFANYIETDDFISYTFSMPTTSVPIRNFLLKKNKADTLSSKGGDETQESKSESVRITTTLMPGYVEEINWSASDPAFIHKQLNKYLAIDLELADAIYNRMLSHSKGERLIVPESSFVLAGWVLHNYLFHIGALRYLRKKNLFAVLAVVYSHLYISGFKDIALTIASKIPDDDDIGFNNNATNRTKLTESLKEDLDSFYPVKKNRLTQKESMQESSIPEIGINMLSENMFSESYISLAPTEHLKEVKGNSSPIVVMNTDLKIRLAELLLFIHNRPTVESKHK